MCMTEQERMTPWMYQSRLSPPFRERWEIISQLRDVIRELRPPGLEEFGLAAALEGFVARLRRERGDIAAVILDLEGNDVALPLTVSLPLFHAARESLRNALTHALARQIAINLRIQAEQAMLRVHDDGVGFDVPPSLGTLAHDGHFGLVCMV